MAGTGRGPRRPPAKAAVAAKYGEVLAPVAAPEGGLTEGPVGELVGTGVFLDSGDPCTRCGGSGVYPHDNPQCAQCAGTGTMP